MSQGIKFSLGANKPLFQPSNQKTKTEEQGKQFSKSNPVISQQQNNNFKLNQKSKDQSGIQISSQKKQRPEEIFQNLSDNEDDNQYSQEYNLNTDSLQHSQVANGISQPQDQAQIQEIEKLARFVAENGPHIEEITKQRNKGQKNVFSFLFDKESTEYKYYLERLENFQNQLGDKRTNRPQSSSQPTKKILGNDQKKIDKNDSEEQQRQKKSKTVEEMDQYYKMLEVRENAKLKKKQEEQEEKDRQQEILNETGCDRRRTYASVKDDGTKGHHMQDFIPQDELQKFMAKCKDAKAQAEAKIMEEKQKIGSDNIGHQLLTKMGWKEGQGIGDKGIVNPLQASGSKPGDNVGLGTQAHGEVTDNDDIYNQYRKRMMLGYKYRPNPLGNPRKSYY